MKRDMDKIREILFALEESKGQPDLRHLLSDTFEMDDLSYHLHLVHQAGLGDGISIPHGGLDGEMCPHVILKWTPFFGPRGAVS